MEASIQLVGTNGTVTLGGETPEEVVYWTIPEEKPSDVRIEEPLQHKMIENIGAELIADTGRTIPSQKAVKTVQLIETLYQSLTIFN